jgi:hypothetical protein
MKLHTYITKDFGLPFCTTLVLWKTQEQYLTLKLLERNIHEDETSSSNTTENCDYSLLGVIYVVW